MFKINTSKFKTILDALNVADLVDLGIVLSFKKDDTFNLFSGSGSSLQVTYNYTEQYDDDLDVIVKQNEVLGDVKEMIKVLNVYKNEVATITFSKKMYYVHTSIGLIHKGYCKTEQVLYELPYKLKPTTKSVNVNGFISAHHKATTHVSDDELRPALNNVMLKPTYDNFLEVVATDAHVIAITRLDVLKTEGDLTDLGIVLSEQSKDLDKVLQKLKKVLKDDIFTVSFDTLQEKGREVVSFSTGNFKAVAPCNMYVRPVSYDTLLESYKEPNKTFKLGKQEFHAFTKYVTQTRKLYVKRGDLFNLKLKVTPKGLETELYKICVLRVKGKGRTEVAVSQSIVNAFTVDGFMLEDTLTAFVDIRKLESVLLTLKKFGLGSITFSTYSTRNDGLNYAIQLHDSQDNLHAVLMPSTFNETDNNYNLQN